VSVADLRLTATLKDGRLTWDAPTVAAVSLGQLNGKHVTVTLETDRQRRSNQANARWWACVVPLAQEIWSRGRPEPYTKEQTHDVLVEVLLGCEDGPLGSRIRRRTSTLTTEQFADLMRRAEELLLHEYGVAVPDQWEQTA